MTEFIYHITSRDAWSVAQNKGAFTTDSLKIAGFIHCSKAEQIIRVANNYYMGHPNLVILKIDTSRIKPPLNWEPGSDKTDELFPHVYGPLNLDAVLGIFDFLPGADGKFLLPPEIGAIHS